MLFFWSLSSDDSSFVHCHVIIPNKEIFSYSLSRDNSFFGRLLQKVVKLCYSDSFLQKTTQQLDGSCNDTSHTQILCKLFKNCRFSCASTYEKYIVNKDYWIAHHDDKLCFVPNCKYHILLIVDIDELLQKLEAFRFTYEHVHCLYTQFKYRFSDKNIAKTGQLFDNVQRTVYLHK